MHVQGRTGRVVGVESHVLVPYPLHCFGSFLLCAVSAVAFSSKSYLFAALARSTVFVRCLLRDVPF